jgi:hypothetical protein
LTDLGVWARILIVGGGIPTHPGTVLTGTTIIGKRQTLIALVLSAVYLAETLVLGVAHHHSCTGCAHSSQTAARQESGQAGASVPVCACSHENAAESKSPRSPRPTRTPNHDQEDCSVCQYLAQGSLHIECDCLPQSGDDVEIIEPARPALYMASLRVSRYSRGPPA